MRSWQAWRPLPGMQVWGSGGMGHARSSAASVGAAVLACVVETQLVVAALQQRLRAAAASSGAGPRLLLPAALAGVELPPYSPEAQVKWPCSVEAGDAGCGWVAGGAGVHLPVQNRHSTSFPSAWLQCCLT